MTNSPTTSTKGCLTSCCKLNSLLGLLLFLPWPSQVMVQQQGANNNGGTVSSQQWWSILWFVLDPKQQCLVAWWKQRLELLLKPWSCCHCRHLYMVMKYPIVLAIGYFQKLASSTSTSTAKLTCRKFYKAISKLFWCNEHLRMPNLSDLQSVTTLHYQVQGVHHGMLGSLNCMHHTYCWKNWCLVGWHRSPQGNKGECWESTVCFVGCCRSLLCLVLACFKWLC